MNSDLLENANIQMEHEPLGTRRKSLLFLILAGVWVFPSAGALFIIGRGWGVWFHAATLKEALLSIALEQWLALALLLFQISFILAAIHYHFQESRNT